MPEDFWSVLLILCVGYTLMLFEIVVPGGVVGIVGAGLVGWGIWQAFDFGVTWGIGAVITSLLVFGLGWRWFLRRGARDGLVLEGDGAAEWKATRDELQGLLGRRGRTLSPLRPAGLARFGDGADEERVDVVSESAFLAQGVEIEVVEVEGNRIVVAAVDPSASAAAEPPAAAGDPSSPPGRLARGTP